MRVEPITAEDAVVLVQLIPNPPTPKHVFAAIVAKDDEGKPVAFAILKVFAEAVLIKDETRSSFEVARALKKLFDRGVEICQSAGIEDLHAFAEDPHYADLLREHLGFSDTPGQALVLRVAGGKQTG